MDWHETSVVCRADAHTDPDEAIGDVVEALRAAVPAASMCVVAPGRADTDEDHPGALTVTGLLRIPGDGPSDADRVAYAVAEVASGDVPVLRVDPARYYARGAGIPVEGQLVRAALTPDLLKPEYRAAPPRAFLGHCYVASQAFYHLHDAAEGAYTPMHVKHEGSTHWWLRHQDGTLIDLTSEQFETPVPYDQGRGSGFLTAQPDKRASIVLARVEAALESCVPSTA